MLNWITAPKSSGFQEALGRILGVSCMVLSADGILIKVHNPCPPLSRFDSCPQLAAAYADFFRASRAEAPTGQIRVLRDPLGLLFAAVDMGSVNMLIGPCLDRGEPDRQNSLAGQLASFSAEQGPDWSAIPEMTVGELSDKARNVAQLYEQMTRFSHETTDLGQQTMLLAAVEEINKLTVTQLSCETFDLRQILDLVASSLIILFDAEGSWVFTHQSGRPVTIHRGQCIDLLQRLRDEWESAVGHGQEWSPGWRGAGRFSLESVNAGRGESRVSIGVVNAQGSYVRMALDVFARQVLIAVEVAWLYESLRQRIGVILNSVHQGIIVTNLEGELMVINRVGTRTLNGHGVTCIPGQPISECGLDPQMVAALRAAARSGDRFYRQRTVLGEGSAAAHIDWEAGPVIDDEGRIQGGILMLSDATELVNLRCRMQDWERLATAGEIAASLAHEIRNPLAAAVGSIQLFEMIDDEPRRRELMSRLRGELARINAILTDYLSLVRPGDGEEAGPVHLSEVVDELRFLLSAEARINGVELIYYGVPPDFPPVLGKKDSLKQVFLNVAKNAIEAMTAGGRLEVSLNRDGSRAWVTFQDNGPGIPHENLNSIFRPFFTTKLGGTGLGLSISNAIIQRMGGELDMDSEVGRGTTVHVVLPIYVQPSVQTSGSNQ